MKNIKRICAVLLSFAMVFTCAGCGDKEKHEDTKEYVEYEESDSKALNDSNDSSDSRDSYDSDTAQSVSNVPFVDTDRMGVRGLSMQVDSATGKLSVTRAEIPLNGETGDEGVWTIFVYLCGSDLESDAGLGTNDIVEMLNADGSDRVRFVVEAGGCSEWDNEALDSDKLERLLIQNDEVIMVDEENYRNMGDPDTLADFLNWGMDNYMSEHMGLVLWNHGGGSVTGICFDELSDFDSLSLADLDEALYDCLNRNGRKFDFIGFDACLMGTVETANILATYADYMYGSQEVEMGSGWDYTAIGDFLAANPDANALKLGEKVCSSFYESCVSEGEDETMTLSVIDLSKMDELLTSFNDFALNMYNAGDDASARAKMVRAIEKADNFGGNNKSEGYTNMVDMAGIINGCREYAKGADKALSDLRSAVAFKISGSAHDEAGGLSMYYPLSVQGSNELSIWGAVCVSPYYLSFVDRQNRGNIDSDYDDNTWFDENGNWSFGEENEASWSYLDEIEQTGESPYITFAVKPQFDEDGTYWFRLDKNGLNNTRDVYAMIYEVADDESCIIELGETYDIYYDYETGEFADDFDGYWLSLPDGQNLATYIVEDNEDYTIYTSPVMLNGEEKNLRIRLDYQKRAIIVEGAWDGISDNGASSRDLIKLTEGDVIVPLYYAYALDSDDEYEYRGVEFTVKGNVEIIYDLMPDGDYVYSFRIDDIYGDYYQTDPVLMFVEGEDVGFYNE